MGLRDSLMAKDETEDFIILNLKVRPDLHADFKLAAKLEGMDMSGMIRNFMVRTVREVKDREPEKFQRNKNLSVIKTKKTLTTEEVLEKYRGRLSKNELANIMNRRYEDLDLRLVEEVLADLGIERNLSSSDSSRIANSK